MFNTETNGANFQYIIHVKHRPHSAMFFLSVLLSQSALQTNRLTTFSCCVNLINLGRILHQSRLQSKHTQSTQKNTNYDSSECQVVKNCSHLATQNASQRHLLSRSGKALWPWTVSPFATKHISVETISPALQCTNSPFNSNEYTKKKKQHMRAVQLGA